MGKKSKAVPVLFQKLADHFDTDPGELPVIERIFPKYDRPKLHQAIEEAAGDKTELLPRGVEPGLPGSILRLSPRKITFVLLM